MEKEYLVKIPDEQLQYVGDMLRYDDCYQCLQFVDAQGNTYWEARLLRWTPERWKSFGFVPMPLESKIPQKEWNDKLQVAAGFTNGVRFAQSWYGSQDVHLPGIMQSLH